MKIKEWILEISAYLAALLFLYTAVSKLIDLETFRGQLNNQVFGNQYTPFLTYAIPLSELAVTILLVWPKIRVYGFAAFTCMMAAFTLYVALVTANYFDRIPCGCATAFEHLSWSWHLAINIFFTLLGGGGLILQLIENKTRVQAGASKYSLREDQEKAENLQKRVSTS
ncbi:MauE/DoxX family redox-associated membrane protein [Arcticibacter tournemirensis]|uniref:Methylamine utilisation protein MauE domain-containing protein n=1 Tax=Arcticibacter tournemirensis TaxID=699437 RepID=A0A4Q0M449_9SPHI|nr:MauE/DoxX family redox-associated membrane protein [Arcticibacter tournemirensis]RXF67718.1 hypothetical protein EKH83_17975 [Arcticibacter tournemirensis]